MTLKQLIARQKKIKAMIADDRSLSYIAEKLGISRTRVWQIAHHHYFDFDPEKAERSKTPSKTKK